MTATGPAVLAVLRMLSCDTIKALVKVQAIAAPGTVAAASRVRTFPARLALPPAPRPVQLADASKYPDGTVSVMVVAVEAAVRVCAAPATPTPDVTVVIVWLAKPLLGVLLKVKGPTPPFETLVTVTVGSLALVKVQTISLAAAVAVVLSSTDPAPRFGVAVPAPKPVQLMFATA